MVVGAVLFTLGLAAFFEASETAKRTESTRACCSPGAGERESYR